MFEKIHWLAQIVGLLILTVQICSYLITSFSNPGFPKSSYETEINESDERNLRQCKDCKLWINTEERTYHCYECEICIEGNYISLNKLGFDHHCPWTSKCIGKGNITSFYIFILFTFLFFVFIISCVSFIDKKQGS